MKKRIILNILMFLAVVSMCHAQRKLKYTIDSDNNLVLAGYEIVPPDNGDEYDRSKTTYLSRLEVEPYVTGKKVVGIAKSAFC